MTHKVLFVDVANSCRGPMAEGFAQKMGLSCESAGTMPAHELSRAAVAAMREKGIDIGDQKPVQLELDRLGDFERIISMGQGVRETSPDLNVHEDWGLENPVNHGLDVIRSVRDDIERRVNALAKEIWEWSSPP